MEVLLLSLYLSRKCFGRRKATRGVRELDLEALTRAARDAAVSKEEFESRVRFELDATWTVFDSEARNLTLQYSRLESAAGKYCQGLKGRLQAREEVLLELDEAGAEPVSCDDPYWRQQLKDGLAALHSQGSTLIQAKMSNHQHVSQLIHLRPAAERSWLLGSLMSHPFFTSRAVRSLMEDVEHLYAAIFCHGSIDVARTSLHGRASMRVQDAVSYGFGVRVGVAVVLLLWVLWDTFVDDPLGKDVWHDPAFKIFRGLGNVVLLLWASGLLVFLLHHVGIDYGRLLSLDPASSSAPDLCDWLWRSACELTIAFLLGFLCFYKALRGVFVHSLPIAFPHMMPLLLSGFMLTYYATRCDRKLLLIRSLRNTLLAPFAPVTFRDTVVADLLTSLVRVVLDLAFTSLYSLYWLHSLFSSSLRRRRQHDIAFDPISSTWAFNKVLAPMITGLPLWWRFTQSLRRAWETGDRSPHYENALKYASALSVSMWGAYNGQHRKDGLWQTAFVLATLYQYYWDVFNDWGLLQWDDDLKLRLRRKLLFKSRRMYYSVMAVNLVLRFLWALTLLPESRSSFLGSELQLRLSPVMAAAEIVRRFIWLLFRLENEHLTFYRPVPPATTAAATSTSRGGSSSRRVAASPPPDKSPTEEQQQEEGQASREGGGEEEAKGRSSSPPTTTTGPGGQGGGAMAGDEKEEDEEEEVDETVRLFEAVQPAWEPRAAADLLQVNGVARSRASIRGDPTILKEAVGLALMLLTVVLSAMLYQ